MLLISPKEPGVVAMLEKLEDKFLEERLQLEKAPLSPVAWRFQRVEGDLQRQH